jgi:hypothetical protein
LIHKPLALERSKYLIVQNSTEGVNVYYWWEFNWPLTINIGQQDTILRNEVLLYGSFSKRA